jgi:hypothetical protein
MCSTSGTSSLSFADDDALLYVDTLAGNGTRMMLRPVVLLYPDGVKDLRTVARGAVSAGWGSAGSSCTRRWARCWSPSCPKR